MRLYHFVQASSFQKVNQNTFASNIFQESRAQGLLSLLLSSVCTICIWLDALLEKYKGKENHGSGEIPYEA